MEEVALKLGLLFRTLAPMGDRVNIRAVVEGIEAMQYEEIAFGREWQCTASIRTAC